MSINVDIYTIVELHIAEYLDDHPDIRINPAKRKHLQKLCDLIDDYVVKNDSISAKAEILENTDIELTIIDHTFTVLFATDPYWRDIFNGLNRLRIEAIHDEQGYNILMLIFVFDSIFEGVE